jgi:crotonobetainyl-CoA:carnitine CoA-transferase CaiB-like acyl-CoA transferase
VTTDARTSSEQATVPAGPALAGIQVVVLGRTRSELLAGRLLADQGAQVSVVQAGLPAGWRAAADPDIVIDADRGTAGATGPGAGSLTDIEAARLVAVGGLYCLFSGLPPGASATLLPSAETLISAELGLNRVADPVGEPEPEPLGIASGYAAIWAAIYLAAALRVRLTTGQGARIEVPLLSAGVSVIGRNLVSPARPELIDPLSLPKLPISDIYECRDGRYVQSHGTFAHFATILCQVIGRPEWAASAAAGVTSLASPAETQMWRDRFAAAFLERDALEWERVLNEAGGACTMCRTHDEWRREREVTRAGIVSSAGERADAPDGLTGPAVTISAEARSVASAGAGAGAQASARPGGSQRDMSWPGLPGQGAHMPLSGVRVLDLCIILAGPTCGRTLAELGADVIKVDSPGRAVSSYGWLDVNRGKRSMLIDLKSADGRELARELAAGADVILENFRAGKIAQLGLGYEALRETHPDLIYGSMNAFDFDSAWAPRAGWEHNAQAGSGMQVARQRNGRPRAVPVPVNDYATGLLAAFGVMLAVLRRDRTGAPAQVRASLARSATFLQLGTIASEAALARPVDDSVCLRTADGWIRTDPGQATPAEVRSHSSAEAAALLRDRGVAAATERTPRDLLTADWARREGLIVEWDHPTWGLLHQGMARMRTSGFEASPGWPAPDPGEHTAAILRQLGHSQTEIDQLSAAGVVAARTALFPDQG